MKQLVIAAAIFFSLSISVAQSPAGPPPMAKPDKTVGTIPTVNPFIKECMDKELPNVKETGISDAEKKKKAMAACHLKMVGTDKPPTMSADDLMKEKEKDKK